MKINTKLVEKYPSSNARGDKKTKYNYAKNVLRAISIILSKVV